MRKLQLLTLFLLAAVSAPLVSSAADRLEPKAGQPLKVGVVNFKSAIEASKYGKQEQANFESLKKQMEAVLEEKDKAVTEIAGKLDDPDYLDSLSPDAENELKHKYRVASQEISQIQGQYYQTLSQANAKILQKLNDLVAEASKKIAADEQYDLILSEEGGFYFSSSLDLSAMIVAKLDAMFDKESEQ